MRLGRGTHDSQTGMYALFYYIDPSAGRSYESVVCMDYDIDIQYERLYSHLSRKHMCMVGDCYTVLEFFADKVRSLQICSRRAYYCTH
jgi:hypothetical protein